MARFGHTGHRLTSHVEYDQWAEIAGTLEIPLFVTAALVAGWAFYRYFPLDFHKLWAYAPNPGLGLVRAALLLSAPWFAYVLTNDAASDIQGYYVAGYVAFAYASVLGGTFWAPVLGLYYPGDVLERSNLAAGIVLSGFAFGTMFAFGGALTGEGPGWHVVLVFFLLAYFELRANAGLVSRISGDLAHAVRIERDTSAAILLAGVCVSSGLISGRAAAGDFLDWVPAFKDYGARLWPIVFVPFLAALVGFLTDGRRYKAAYRILTAALLVLFGVYWYFFT